MICNCWALQASSLYEKIEAINLHAFKPESPSHHSYATYTEQLQSALAHQKHVSYYQKRRLAFSIFKTHEKSNPLTEDHVIDETTWRDLNLFVGSASKPQAYVGNMINYAATELGAVRLLGMLANPHHEIADLRIQQNTLTELIENEELFSKIDAALNELKLHENILYSWFDDQDPFITNALFFKWIKTPGWPALATMLNKISPLLEMRESLYLVNMLFILLQQTAGTVIFPLAALLMLLPQQLKQWAMNTLKLRPSVNYAQQLKQWAMNTLKLWPSVNYFYVYGFALYLASQIFKNSNTLTAANDLVVGQNNWLSFWATYDQLSANKILIEGLQLKLVSLAHCVKIIQTIRNVTEESPILHKRITDLLHSSEAFNELEYALQNNMYAGDEFYAGSILSTAKLAYDHHQDCINMLVAIGEIDALMSLAKLYKFSAASKNSWSFAQFESAEPDYEEQTTIPAWYNTTKPIHNCFKPSDNEPFMQLDEFWNPLLKPSIAVANTLSMGDSQPRTLIITGINKGGKSTNMKAIILNALCAQSLGIVPADLYIATPFTKIITYCNPEDDIIQGISHFEAGERRALYLYNIVEQLYEDHHALCMLDEAFDGTHHAVSAAATKTLIQHLGYNPHVICITTTHLPEVTKIAEEHNGNYFANYHVASTLNPDKGITFTYQLKPGVSYQNELALELLRQHDYPPEFIDAAYQELEKMKS
jgi:hypothetical protein